MLSVNFANITLMNKMQKIKRMILIALGFGLSTYLIMSGMAMLDAQEKVDAQKQSIDAQKIKD